MRPVAGRWCATLGGKVWCVLVVAVVLICPRTLLGDEVGPTQDLEFFNSLREELAQPLEIATPTSITPRKVLRRRALLGVARNAVAADDRQQALATLSQLSKEFPHDPDIGFEHAGALMRWGEWRTAEQQLRTLLESDPRAPRRGEYAIALTDVLVQQQRHEEACAVLITQLEQRPESTLLRLRLGRLFAWRMAWEEADRTVDGLATSTTPLPTRETLELAAFYLETGRSDLTLKTLNQLAQQATSLPTAHALRVRALADRGQTAAAISALGKLEQGGSLNDRERLDLADALYRSEHYQAALVAYQQVGDPQKTNHANMPAPLRAKMVRTYVRLWDLPAAAQLLGPTTDTEDAELLSARANFLTVAGRHAEAESVCRRLMSIDGSDPDHRNAYGHLYYSIGDFLCAESEYRQSLCLAPASLKTLPFVARAMMRSEQHAAAVTMLRAEMTDNSRARSLRPVLIEVLLEGGRARAAAKQCQQALADERRPASRHWLRIQLGTSLLYRGENRGALSELKSVFAEIGPTNPKLVYHLAKAYRRLGQTEQAEEVIKNFEQSVGPNLAKRIAMADLATEVCDGCFAERMLAPALAASPGNVALLNRLGESRALIDRPRGTRGDRAYFQQALALSPDNTRAKLGLARSYARTKQPARSCKSYRQILNRLPSHRLAASELSRVTYGAAGPTDGVASFSQSRRRLAADRSTNPVAVTEQLAMPDSLATASPAEIEQAWAQRQRRLLSLEQTAKAAKPWRPRSSINCYRSLILEDRINEEARFDLGQVYGQLNRTRAAAAEFSQLLEVNPCHTEAEWALARTQLELGPQSWSSVRWDERQGRDGLTEISRTRLQTLARLPKSWLGKEGDEDEFLYAGYARDFLVDAFDRSIDGDAFQFGGATKPFTYTRLFADLEIVDYDIAVSTRLAGRIGVQSVSRRDVQWTFAGFLNNVLDNSESINQDIFRTGLEGSLFFKPHWRQTLTAGYRWSDYSDDNQANEAYVLVEHLLKYGCGRCQWRLLADVYYFDFAEPTVFVGAPGDLAGAIHPYFSPAGFVFSTLSLEYKRWLSRHNHKYANHWWWSAAAGGRVDSEGFGYGVGSFRLHRDHRAWLTSGVQASLVRSEVFDSTGVRAFLTARW